MDKNQTATETNAQNIATAGTEVKVSTVDMNEDLLAKYSALEASKAKAEQEKENYRIAYLKEKAKKDSGESVDSDELMRLTIREELANSQLATVALQQHDIIQATMKENRELKLANLNRSTTTSPAGMGSHSEAPQVRDTLVTPDQDAELRKRGWDDKKIALYKKNYSKSLHR